MFLRWTGYTKAMSTSPIAIIDSLHVIKDRLFYEAEANRVQDCLSISGAGNDYLSVIRFLLAYDANSGTFNAYRRDVERLLQWSWRIRQASIHSLSREDFIAFFEFVQQPPVEWIGHKNVARFVVKSGERAPNPDWRPFVISVSKADFRAGKTPDKATYSPSHASIRANFKILSSFYDYLTEESYLQFNPIAQIRQKSKFLRRESGYKDVKRISELQWSYVLETAGLMADKDPESHERTLFIISALYLMYLRVSELVADERAAPVMGDFKRDTDGNWWFHVTGKGNKYRTVTVSNSMLDALKRFRLSRNMTPLPQPSDSEPLVAKTRGKGPVTSSRMIRKIVQECFDQAYIRMCADISKQDAEELLAATVHWLRHTGISEDVKTRPRDHVRDDAGHGSMATTDLYIESNRRERHASGKNKKVDNC